MKHIETFAVLLLVVILATTPALAGGLVKLGFSTSTFFNNTNFGYLKSQFNNSHVVSGTAPRAEFNASLDSSLLTKVTNYGATLNDTDTYFAHTLGKYNVSAGEVGEKPNSKLVTVNTYTIMPHKFDSIQFIDLHFDSENLSQADVRTNLTYKGKTYQFEVPETIKDNESSFNLFLQPFCKEFENIGIDAISSTYEETGSSSGIDYSGSLTIQAGRV